MVSKRERIPASERLRSAERRDDEVHCSISDEAEKPKAGNEDGEDGEGDKDPAGLLLSVIQFIKVAIHESVDEG